ncbi:Sept6ps, septin GTPase, pseudogene [Ectocarpus siliculosus]|nr:Sept6ps, septin GTPase, pseudogene [Ectocarpus siliculosus]|eukprot:CBJ31640.1 Sept6ps, septin GTPase, pseudogene [Ectocarpus siliculosus]
MTVDEMIGFKKAIVDSAAQANGVEFFNFSERAWGKCLGALNIADEPIWLGERRPPPYAVISSQVDDPNGNAHAPDPAKPVVIVIGEKIREYRHPIASGKPSIIFVVLAVICAIVAVILAHTQGYCVNGNEPSTGLADWSEVILKMQQLEGSDRILTAIDPGEEPLYVLMEVLMDDRKIWTETSEEAQQEVPPGENAATIGKDPANKGIDRPQVPDKPATRSAGTQTSGSTTIPDDGSSRNKSISREHGGADQLPLHWRSRNQIQFAGHVTRLKNCDNQRGGRNNGNGLAEDSDGTNDTTCRHTNELHYHTKQYSVANGAISRKHGGADKPLLRRR